jgi:hypothetical protein
MLNHLLIYPMYIPPVNIEMGGFIAVAAGLGAKGFGISTIPDSWKLQV